jgi:hypothetical protein
MRIKDEEKEEGASKKENPEKTKKNKCLHRMSLGYQNVAGKSA